MSNTAREVLEDLLNGKTLGMTTRGDQITSTNEWENATIHLALYPSGETFKVTVERAAI